MQSNRLNSLSRVESVQPNTNGDIPPQTEITEEHSLGDYARFYRGARQPVRLKIVTGTISHSLRWQLSGYFRFQGDTITLGFVDYTVTIEGKNLGELFDYLNREKIHYLTESRETGPGIPSYVEKIDVKPSN